MKIPPSGPPVCGAVLVAAACLLAQAGCHRDPTGGGPSPHEEEHAGHVIPAHKPKDFPAAVRRLRELNRRIAQQVSEAKVRSLLADRTLPVALDIATWLPEIAADSDMPEMPWDQVDARSVVIAGDYRRVLEGGVAAAAAVDEADRTISDLEAILAAADPRWFDDGARGAPAAARAPR